MKIYSSNPSNLNHNIKNIHSNANKSQTKTNHKKRLINKVAPFLIGLTVLGGAQTCSNNTNSKFSGYDNYDGITVEFSNVKQSTKDSVMKPVYDMKTDLTCENDFLEGTKFDIADDFEYIDKNDSFKKYLAERKAKPYIKGVSFYSDSRLQNRVAVQELSHENSYSEIRQSVMHEVGHLFDNYFGHDHSSDIAQTWDSLLYSKEISPSEIPYEFQTETFDDKKLDVEYNWNNNLSDKKEFQEALLRDLNYISRLRRISGSMPKNINYYIDDFDFTKGITPEDVDLANRARAEIYANLFSYAAGQDDGNKSKFVKCFRNCYKIVNIDIKKYLGDKKSEM